MTERSAPGLPATLGALTVSHLSRVYGTGDSAVRALDDVSFVVERGEMLCIMGKSGSGKSTLLRILGLIDRPTSGTVLLDETDMSQLPESARSALRLDRFGYIFQEYALLSELTAEENVFLPRLMLGESKAECRRRAHELLELLELGGRASHRPSEMSGGEQQRVAIARAMINEPTTLFADEPTGNLDTRSTVTVMEALVRMNQARGVTVIFVSHDPDHRDYASNLLFLRDGHIVEDQT
jgi:putative ABC transport system ATP-binding protein